MAPAVLYEIRDRVAYVTLNRPDKLNAINGEMKDLLLQAFEDIRVNPDAWAVLLAANGRAFSAGRDLLEMEAGGAPGRSTHDLYQLIHQLKKPTVVAINGICLAQGAGLALACDVRFASDKAEFGWPQVRRGITSVSGPTLLAEMLPLNIALEMLYSGETIGAEMALRWGLVNRVVPPERLADEAGAFVRRIVGNAPLSLRAIKEAAIRGHDMTLEGRVRFAELLLEHIQATEDAREGLAAFREKRPPVWKGR